MIVQGRSFSGLERHCSFLNTNPFSAGQGRFATISATSGLDFPDDGRALAIVDWDHDGDLDLWMSARNAPRLRLMQNQAENNNHFLTIGLTGNGTTTNRDAIGARVEVILKENSEEKSIQTLRAGEGFFSQDSKWLHFGLGQNKTIDHVLVHWPGGEKEKFTGITIDGRYKLTQGTTNGMLSSGRDSKKLLLEPTKASIPEPSQQARIALMTKLPKPTLAIREFDNTTPQILQVGVGGPVLVTLWASWCPTCKEELIEFVKRKDDLRKAGIGVLALSVDGLNDERSDIELAQKLLIDLQFPFSVGLATPGLIQELQGLHDLVVPLKHPLPVPASFLIDGTGQLSVIYKGKADVDAILRDGEHLAKGLPFSLEHITPLAGRSIHNEHLNRVFIENKVRTLFQQGISLGDRNRNAEAVLYFLKALELRPKSYKIHYNLGTSYVKLNNPEAAIHHLELAIESNPDFLLSHKAMGGVLMRSGNYQKAAAHYQKVLAGSPDDAEVVSSLGIIEGRTGNFTKALEYLTRAIKINPNFVEARYNLGTILLLQNNLKEAENEFLQVMKIQPDYPDVLYNLGYMAETSGQTQSAANLYTGELRNYPSSVKAITGLARLFENQGDYREASEYYTRAIGIRPDYEPAIEGLTRLNKYQNQP
jgi:tetratricopeptide (TPR) repeat protein/peroxiredoxin